MLPWAVGSMEHVSNRQWSLGCAPGLLHACLPTMGEGVALSARFRAQGHPPSPHLPHPLEEGVLSGLRVRGRLWHQLWPVLRSHGALLGRSFAVAVQPPPRPHAPHHRCKDLSSRTLTGSEVQAAQLEPLRDVISVPLLPWALGCSGEPWAL